MTSLLSTALSCFVATRIFAPYDVDSSRPYWTPKTFHRPATVAMDQSGSIAALLRSSTGGLDLVGIRRRGLETVLRPPSSDALRHAFSAAQIGPSGQPIFPDAAIAAVALSHNVPIVTVTNRIAGAFSGTETATFRWTGTAWKLLFVNDAKHRQNVWVAGASDDAAAFGMDALSKSPAQLVDVPYPSATGALWVVGNVERRLEGVIPTGAGAGSLWGYRIAHADGASSAPRASYWTNTGEHDLSDGVIWDSNAGVLIGDDRARLDVIGRPIAVVKSALRHLGVSLGSAFGVNSSRVVVGSYATTSRRDDAFVVDLKTESGPVALDTLLEGDLSHISEAYSIADNGTVLALSEFANDIRFVLLTPTTHHPPCKR